MGYSAENIESQAGLIFERLRICNCFKDLPHDEFVEEIVDCIGNLGSIPYILVGE